MDKFKLYNLYSVFKEEFNNYKFNQVFKFLNKECKNE